MEKIETELFSEEQIENISDLLDKNYHVLSKIENYTKQQKKISKFHAEICNNSSGQIKYLFCEYDCLISDSRRYELSLLYHLGLKKGLEMKDLKNT